MEQEIVNIAIDNLNQITGIKAKWLHKMPLDGVLTLQVGRNKFTFIAEVKREVRTFQLQQMEEYFHQYENFILVANRIFPKIKEELRQKEIPYLEANGNVFLKKDDLFLFVDTQAPLNNKKNKGNRAFTKTGLKVLFYLLQHREAINLTQRELAAKTDVGLGNIPQVIEGLRETGYLIPLKNNSYVWENRKELLDRWITEYATVLRPKLMKEKYTMMADWQTVHFDTGKTVWGGEPAADVLTNYLRPEKYLIYTRENRKDLIKKYHLKPQDKGEIQVLEMFWKPEEWQTAPPILVYADLILEGGKRNIETANKIYNEFIQPII